MMFRVESRIASPDVKQIDRFQFRCIMCPLGCMFLSITYHNYGLAMIMFGHNHGVAMILDKVVFHSRSFEFYGG